ncbi:hypothetical protein QC761_0096860 [Podospora bellae-mahoneyi]|uniref:Uncharacterized protein n=1 Tax=Podospora bellae-mahoneyi TaxID=2093777 RepID=A0ABR0FAA2_9PEZI|nr:hypothetical protein QC761_0096860 [Podospora bellae-mahoneyi]
MSAISSHICNIEIHLIRSHFATNFYGRGTCQFLRQCETSRATPRPSTTPTTTTMEINALINHNDIDTSPTAERFYRLQLARQQRPHWHLKAHRAPELPRKQKIQICALREYAYMSYAAMREATGASDKQIQYALTTPLTRELTVVAGSPRGLPTKRRTVLLALSMTTLSLASSVS